MRRAPGHAGSTSSRTRRAGSLSPGGLEPVRPRAAGVPAAHEVVEPRPDGRRRSDAQRGGRRGLGQAGLSWPRPHGKLREGAAQDVVGCSRAREPCRRRPRDGGLRWKRHSLDLPRPGERGRVVRRAVRVVPHSVSIRLEEVGVVLEQVDLPGVEVGGADHVHIGVAVNVSRRRRPRSAPPSRRDVP